MEDIKIKKLREEMPERRYIFDYNDAMVTPLEGDTMYVREDAFIEKVARFLEYKLNDRVEIQVWGTLIPSLTSKKAFIEDFRKYKRRIDYGTIY